MMLYLVSDVRQCTDNLCCKKNWFQAEFVLVTNYPSNQKIKLKKPIFNSAYIGNFSKALTVDDLVGDCYLFDVYTKNEICTSR